MMVKICGITSLDDALAAAEAGASALGFNFYDGSPRRIATADAAAISARLPSGVLKVGVFVDAPPEAVLAIAAEVGLDLVQLHGGEAPARALLARGSDCRLKACSTIDAMGPRLSFSMTAVAGLHGGTGRSFRWELARNARPRHHRRRPRCLECRRSHPRRPPVGRRRVLAPRIVTRRKDHDKMLAFIHSALAASA